jgi:rhamnulokinase
MTKVIAVDLGASQGRVMGVTYGGDGFTVEEVHRFPNVPVKRGRHLCWNVKRLWQEAVKGIEWARGGASSVGIDSWGVDYGLLDKNGSLLGDPVHYRDPRTRGVMEWVFKRMPRREIFDRTGVQFLELNTLYQMASLVKTRSRLLKRAATYLGLPDLFNFWFTGERRGEFTHATTTQMFNPREIRWDEDILEAVKIPVNIFPEVVEPGEFLGESLGLRVCAPACHDTGSAVAAVPTKGEDFSYISSGTWSLLGTEVGEPVINDAVYRNNFTNEGGAGGTFRLLRNLPGLWFEQELLREWRMKGSVVGYGELYEAAEKAPPFTSLIDPNDPVFHDPGDMTPRIGRYCAETGQEAPMSIGEHIRCVYESLALNYRHALGQLEEITGGRPPVVHIIGGGSLNRVLNQMTADSTGAQVVAGPVEATALGNAVVQLVSLGELGSVSEAREVLSETLGLQVYSPGEAGGWDEAYVRFKYLLEGDTG